MRMLLSVGALATAIALIGLQGRERSEAIDCRIPRRGCFARCHWLATISVILSLAVIAWACSLAYFSTFFA